MKFSRYFSFVCILAIVGVFALGCEKMEKPVMDAMDMAMTDTETETPTEMDGTTETPAEMDMPAETETPAEMDMPAETETPAEMDMSAETDMPAETETPAEMEPDATITISPTEIALPEVGEQFTITANIDSKVAVVGYQFDLKFDATVLKYVEHSISNYLSENEAEIEDHSMVDDGNLTIVAVSRTSTGIGEGTLAAITFEVIEKQASTIVLSDVLVTDSAAELLDAAISEDTVVIQ